MTLEKLPIPLTVCKLPDLSQVPPDLSFFFLSVTDQELSLVCPTAETPAVTAAREDGWRGFRVRGELDFSLVGVLAGLTRVLADQGIGLFAVSTFNTDYILVKEGNFVRAEAALSAAGYAVV